VSVWCLIGFSPALTHLKVLEIQPMRTWPGVLPKLAAPVASLTLDSQVACSLPELHLEYLRVWEYLRVL
jgi:hypothetical protein